MHQTVGTMVIGAGLVSVLLDFVKNTRDGALQLTAANKAVVLLDGFLYGYTSAFTAYMSAGGLNDFIERIKVRPLFPPTVPRLLGLTHEPRCAHAVRGRVGHLAEE